jgi:DNA-binding NarL/FixJ family response regulator
MIHASSPDPERSGAVTSVTVMVSDALLARRVSAAITQAEPALALASPADAAVAVLADEGSNSELGQRIGAARAGRPGRSIVVVTQTESAGRCHRLLDLGADGVVLALAVDGGLASAVAAVAAGHVVQPRNLVSAQGPGTLSHRERQVLGLVVLGFSNGEIGRQLYLAESTVKCHMQSIFAKLGVASRKQAVAAVLDPHRGLGLGIVALTTSSGEPIPTQRGD